MKIIVCDTGPILHLIEANLLQLLKKAGKIYIPEMVDREMSSLCHLWEKDRPRWITIEPLLPDELIEAMSLFHSGLLDIGEAEAVLLAKRLKPDWFLTDDTTARVFAHSLNMEVHRSLGMILWFAAVGHLNANQAEKALNNLSKTSLWISKDILSQAKKTLEIMFKNSSSR